jgi:hypothetical protein
MNNSGMNICNVQWIFIPDIPRTVFLSHRKAVLACYDKKKNHKPGGL